MFSIQLTENLIFLINNNCKNRQIAKVLYKLYISLKIGFILHTNVFDTLCKNFYLKQLCDNLNVLLLNSTYKNCKKI